MTRIYSNLKFLGFTDRLQALREGTLVAPVHIRIKPINRCNHHCWYCAYRADTLQLGEDMDLDSVIPEAKMFEIVEDVVAMGVKAVTFSGGGEPLLYKPLPDVIDRLAAGGVRVGCLSNGANLRGRMADAFARHGTWMRISIDAWDDESYSRGRGAPEGGFTRLLDTMRAFQERSSPCVLGVSLIVGKENHAHIHEVCARLKDVGVNHVKVAGVVVSNSGAENNAYHRPILAAAGEQIARAQALNDARFQVVNHYHELSERFDKDYTSCPFLQFLTVIGADCNVYTCQDKAYNADGLLGSIADRRFKDFWLSDGNRRRVQAHDPSRLCQHNCVQHAKNLILHDLLSVDADHAVFV
ncbi:MAG TPA: radical SAM/SPASM domain-containing protein [Azospirillum sp.]